MRRFRFSTIKFATSLAAVLLIFICAPAQATEYWEYCKYAKRNTLFLVDRTTSYDEIDQMALFDGVEQMVFNLQPGERLIVHIIADDPLNSRKIFEGCSPGCPVSFNPWDWVMSTCKDMLARREKREFMRKLADAIKPVLKNVDQFQKSEILRTIILLTHEYRRKNINNLIIYSDLLENSKQYPWPRIVSVQPEGAIENIGQPPFLKGVSVVVFGFGRDHGLERMSLSPETRKSLVAFWNAFFTLGEARDVSITLYYPN